MVGPHGGSALSVPNVIEHARILPRCTNNAGGLSRHSSAIDIIGYWPADRLSLEKTFYRCGGGERMVRNRWLHASVVLACLSVSFITSAVEHSSPRNIRVAITSLSGSMVPTIWIC